MIEKLLKTTIYNNLDEFLQKKIYYIDMNMVKISPFDTVDSIECGSELMTDVVVKEKQINKDDIKTVNIEDAYDIILENLLLILIKDFNEIKSKRPKITIDKELRSQIELINKINHCQRISTINGYEPNVFIVPSYILDRVKQYNLHIFTDNVIENPLSAYDNKIFMYSNDGYINNYSLMVDRTIPTIRELKIKKILKRNEEMHFIILSLMKNINPLYIIDII